MCVQRACVWSVLACEERVCVWSVLACAVCSVQRAGDFLWRQPAALTVAFGRIWYVTCHGLAAKFSSSLCSRCVSWF